MIEGNLNKLIDLNERIVSQNEKLIRQNDEIISLLKQMNGEEESSDKISMDLGNGLVFDETGQVSTEGLVFNQKDEEETVPENLLFEKNDTVYFEKSLNPGEVLFVANSPDDEVGIYRLSVKSSDELKVSPSEITEEITRNFDDINYEITLDNLTGEAVTYQFKLPLLVAFESLDKDASIDSCIAILDDEVFMNLPEMIRVAMEDGADKIHLPMKNAVATLGAPPALMNHLEFYKTPNQVFDKLF